MDVVKASVVGISKFVARQVQPSSPAPQTLN
jgi:hypothetical protein